MSQSSNVPNLNSSIVSDLTTLNALLKAMRKLDPSGFTDLEAGTIRFSYIEVEDVVSIERLANNVWVQIGHLNISASKLGGHSASTVVGAGLIPIRDANGKLAGDIKGNAHTASSAAALSETLPINRGGTGGTTADMARQYLGVPSTEEFNNSMADANEAIEEAYARGSQGVTAAAVAQSTANAKWTAINASTSVKGIVQLSSSVTSTSTTTAANSAAVKKAYDRGSLGVTNAANAQTTANGNKTIINDAISRGQIGNAISNDVQALNNLNNFRGVLTSSTESLPTGVTGGMVFSFRGGSSTALYQIIVSSDGMRYRIKGSGQEWSNTIWRFIPSQAPYITDSWANSTKTQWYRKWSNGFIEQGVYVDPTASLTTFTLPTRMATDNYTVVGTGVKVNGASIITVSARTTTSVSIRELNVNEVGMDFPWMIYIAGY